MHCAALESVGSKLQFMVRLCCRIPQLGSFLFESPPPNNGHLFESGNSNYLWRRNFCCCMKLFTVYLYVYIYTHIHQLTLVHGSRESINDSACLIMSYTHGDPWQPFVWGLVGRYLSPSSGSSWSIACKRCLSILGLSDRNFWNSSQDSGPIIINSCL